ncbi:MAG TPA: type II secretion system F family protein, partial [Bdellovibrio sp.]|nr:type II secretion system F family protein [Bdellovibrio sp.]
MAKFQYQAKGLDGKTVIGDIEAGSQQEAVVRLRAQKLTPVRVASSAPKNQGMSAMFSGRVSSKDLQIFTRQFATLINAGIPVVDSLKILSEGLRPGLLKEASAQVKTSIEGGRRLADSMAQSPRVFDKLYCNMIQAGEEAGILDGILLRLASYMEKSEKLKGQVKGALTYPVVIICVAILVITGILVFIIPKFMEFFASSGQKPPMLTQMVVNLSHSLVSRWYVYVGLAVGVPFLLSRYVKT